jgi:hypothetical protein
MTGCGATTPGVANPAGTTASSSTSTAPTVPNSVPDSATTVQPPAESSTTEPEPTEPSPQERTSQEPTSQEPTSQGPSSQEQAPDEPTVLPTDLSGEVYGFIHAVDVAQSQMTFDKVDWFWGADAEQACAVDNVSDERRLDGWCSVYYFRNVNPKLRVVTVHPDVVITSLEGTTPVSDDLQTLADRTESTSGWFRPCRVIVTDGAVVAITQIYQP